MTKLSDRILIAVKELKGGQGALGKAIGVHRNTIASWIAENTSPSHDQLQAIAQVTNKEFNWILTGDEDGGDSKPHGEPELSGSIPIFGTAAGSITGSIAIHENIIDWVSRPPGLKNAQNAYALYVTGNSMQPKYSPGDLIFLHPGRPPRAGDIIVLQTQSHKAADVVAHVKEYVRRSGKGIVTRQYNEPLEIEFKFVEVKEMHRVTTLNELFNIS